VPVAEAETRLDFVYIRTLTANSEMTASRQPFEEYGCRVLAGQRPSIETDRRRSLADPEPSDDCLKSGRSRVTSGQ